MQGSMGVEFIAMAGVSIMGILGVVPQFMLHMIIATIITLVVSTVLTVVFGFQEELPGEVKDHEKKAALHSRSEANRVIASPMSGEVMDIACVKKSCFSLGNDR